MGSCNDPIGQTLVQRLRDGVCGGYCDELGQEAADEIEHLREAVRSARADEEHCWASRVDALTAQLHEVDARYMALLKAVADGVAMQPKTVVLKLGPND